MFFKTYTESARKGAKYSLIILTALLLSSFSFISWKYYFDGKTPEDSLADLEVAEGLEVKLFASEPMITNPTNIDVDAKGRVWVCEGFNYRSSLNPSNPVNEKGDRIMILEDTDGDSKADKSKVFYQGTDVNASLGIAVLGNKVYVSSSPNIFVFTDENGDDVPDKKEILFSGLKGEDHDHGTHSVNFGPDGKLYFSVGNEGKAIKDKNGKILKDKEGVEVEAIGKPYRQGMVLRCNPDGSGLEVLGHNFRNNYEAAVDAFGTIWQSDNDDDGNKSVRINYVMEGGNYGYTDELTGAGWSSMRMNMEKDIPSRHWHQNNPGVVPNLLLTGAGSPTGLLIYEGELLPKVFHNQIIHTDAGPNVVRAYPVTVDKAGYKATIIPILKSKTDQWFRPSDVCVAPDGSLIIADWYDPGVGGHQMKNPVGGRIYRVAPPKSKYSFPTVNVSTFEGAAEALKSPNPARRYLGYKKFEAGGKSSEKVLLTLWKNSNPRIRARAFWLLNSLGDKYLKAALSDADPDIKIMAIRAAKWKGDDVVSIVKQMKNDPSPQVRRELALSLRHNKSKEAPKLWAELAQKHTGEDRWYIEALGIGADKNWESYFAAWEKLVGNNWNNKAGRDVIWRARNKEAMPYLAQLINDPAIGIDEKLRYFRSFDFQVDPSKHQVLSSLLKTLPKEDIAVRKLVYSQMEIKKETLTPEFIQDLNQLLDKIKGESEFITIVKKFNLKERSDDLIEIVTKDPYANLALEAGNAVLEFNEQNKLKSKALSKDRGTSTGVLKILGRIESEKSRSVLESVFMDGTADIETKKLAIQSYPTGWSGEEAMVSLLNKRVLPKDLQREAALRLLYAGRQSIKSEALKYLDVSATASSLPSIGELSKEKGNFDKGRIVFENTCTSCHQVNGKGINFGPDLSEIGSKLPKEALLYSILEPDAGISFGYEGFKVQSKGNETAVGIISSETETDLELKKLGGVVTKYKKSEVASKEQLKQSLMPNLSLTLKKEDLVNLVEYLSKLEKNTKMSGQ